MSRLQIKTKAKSAKRAKTLKPKIRVKTSTAKRKSEPRKSRAPKVALHQPVAELLPPRQRISLERGHPPQVIDDLPWPKSYRDRLFDFVEKNTGNLLFAGWPGTGKSECAKLIVRLMDMDEFWVDASDDATLEKLKNAKASSTFSFFKERCAVIIDEADSYGLKALQSLRGKALDNPDATFIIICNDIRKIPDAVRSRCEEFLFDETDRDFKREVKSQQQRRARDILYKLDIEFTEKDIAAAWASNPKVDFRKGLRALEYRLNGDHQPEQNDQDSVSVIIPDAPPLVPDIASLTLEQRETAEIFYLLKAAFQKYLVLPAGGAETLAIFVLHAYAHDAATFSAILAITSPQKSCGKTATLHLLRNLIVGALSTVNITPAALFERADEGTPLLIDEADCFLKPGSDLIQLLNGGVDRGSATVYRAGKKEYRVWCPKVIARIGRIVPDPLASRCIDVRMKRALPDDEPASIPLDLKIRFLGLRERCQAWADGAMDQLRAAVPAMPATFRERKADKWRALFAIADLAGPSVAQEVRAAAIAIEDDGDIDEDQGTLLLEDIRSIIDDSGDASVFTFELANELRRLPDRPWASGGKGLDIRISRILADYKIRPENIRRNGKQRKGYYRWKFEDLPAS